MKPWIVVRYPKNLHELWFFDNSGNPLRRREWMAYTDNVQPEKHADTEPFAMPVFFCNDEATADAVVNETLRQHPGETVLKLQTKEMAQTTIGPVQKAQYVDGNLLPI